MKAEGKYKGLRKRERVGCPEVINSSSLWIFSTRICEREGGGVGDENGHVW